MAQAAGSGHGIDDVYKSVINDVISQIKDAFLDENIEIEVLEQLRKSWETKVQDSGAVDLETQKPVPPPANVIRPNPRQPSTSGIAQQPVVTSQPNQGVQQYILQQHQQQPQLNLNNMNQPMLIRQQQPQQSFQSGQQAIFMSNGQFINQNNQNIQLVSGSGNQPNQQYAIMSGGRMMIVNPGQVLNPQLINALTRQQQGQGNSNLPQLDGSNNIEEPGSTNKVEEKSGTIGIVKNPKQPKKFIIQLDGGGVGMSDSSSDEDEEDNLQRLAGLQDATADDGEDNDEEPLNSDDDQSDEEDLRTLFESDNVVICQFEKVHRARSKWKFILKDGIMHLNGKDYCFQRCTGEAEW